MIARVYFSAHEFAVDDFVNAVWQRAEPVEIRKLWSGADTPATRFATARLAWTSAALFVRFDCEQHEPLIIAENPDATREAARLWERDVCELFIAPDADRPNRYFEFEIAPTGEWLDFAILQLENRRETDTSFDSGMTTAAKIEDNGWTGIFRVEWQALGAKPKAGDEWRGNLFRCIGTGDSRYLAWLPTRTAQPNFHVPDAFGDFKF